jgi:hypothetical protein
MSFIMVSMVMTLEFWRLIILVKYDLRVVIYFIQIRLACRDLFNHFI